MEIKRCISGSEVSIELTPKEILDAYYLQEHVFDEDDVRNTLDEWVDEEFSDYGVTRKEAEELIPEIAYEKRRLMNKYDMSWEFAVRDAIKTVLMNQEDNGKDDK